MEKNLLESGKLLLNNEEEKEQQNKPDSKEEQKQSNESSFKAVALPSLPGDTDRCSPSSDELPQDGSNQNQN